MAEFSEIVHKAWRMCRNTKNCNECRIGNNMLDCTGPVLPLPNKANISTFEKLVLDWNASHPSNNVWRKHLGLGGDWEGFYYCPKCKKVVAERHTFCPSCGQEMEM